MTADSSTKYESAHIDAGTPDGVPHASVNDDGERATSWLQEPIAVVSMACRLPDACDTPHEFWKFLEQGKIAINTPPGTRFSLASHYDASLKPQTMASPGGMFLQNVDIRDIDAKFFRLSGVEATSMDPQQRQLLEVVYEGLENAGVPIEDLNDAPVGCFVSSFASDYSDIQSRDPENRASATVVGVGRAMLSARIAHWLNIHGPCMTLDTACSGALVGLDLAMRYLQTREASSAIVAGANIYCSPEWVMDRYMGANGTASLSGRCHTFDEKADGYIKSEAVCMVYLKRLDDAIRDKDPIRAIIRGTATNQDGWTAGIASPSAPAQTAVIRQAYRNAGIADISKTSYIEFHGTGTKAGDSIEANGVSAVFTPHQPVDRPLRIGSVKSNIGHSEPAAGLSALMKCVLSLEKGVIPGNPTFITPSPKIDFEKIRMYTSRTATSWPAVEFRRASVNCFGYGGSNAHAIIDEARPYATNHISSYAAEDDFDSMFDNDASTRPYLLVLSANEEKSLDDQVSALDGHLSNPAVSAKMRDLAFTLGQKRSRHYHRGFLITDTPRFDVHALTRGHESADTQRLGFVFTGQGAQWPTMGKVLLESFPIAAFHIRSLDQVLQSCPDPPKWSLFDELLRSRTAEHLRLPEISQPVVTALQLAILAIFDAANIKPQAVVGHSSGEIAAAVAAGLLTPKQAILIAYYRGMATSMVHYNTPLGMMAVGLGADDVAPYITGSSVQVACVNSPQGVTLSGVRSELLEIEAKIKEAGYFARLLQVNAAYHSRHMAKAARIYLDLLKQRVDLSPPKHAVPRNATVPMFSSTTGQKFESTPGPEYWVANMESPVLFSTAVQDMMKDSKIGGVPGGIDTLIEIGPSNALAGPINQIKKATSSTVEYISAWKRGEGAMQNFLETAGKLFITGYPVKLAPFNQDEESESPRFIVDLPNYRWNHSVKYWHENESSLDWRFRRFVHHDLLGSKILGTPWERPTWKNVLRVSDVTWIQDHLLGDSIIFPGAGYIAMAVEAIYQKWVATGRLAEGTERRQVTYKLRNVTFPRMLKLDKEEGSKMLLALEPCMSTRETWHEFVISTISKESTDVLEEHCRGLVSIGEHAAIPATPADVAPLKHAVPGAIWAKAMREVGYHFGPAFLPTIMVEAKADSRQCRSQIQWQAPESRYPQSPYSMHPTIIDGCLQVATVALNRGYHSAINTLMPPALMDDLVIFPQPEHVASGIVSSEAKWSGVGNPDDSKRFVSDIRGFGWGTDHKDMLFYLRGLHYHAINASMDRPHVLTQVIWGEDISLMSAQQISNALQSRALAGHDSNTAIARVGNLVSMIAHKNPLARILEVSSMSDEVTTSSTSLWIDTVRSLAGPIAQGCAYHLSLSSSNSALKARETYGGETNINFVVHESDKSNAFVAEDDSFDLILVRASASSADREELQRALRSLNPGGFVVLLHEGDVGRNGEAAGTPDIVALEAIPHMRTQNDAQKVAFVGRRTPSVADDDATVEPAETAVVNLVHFKRWDTAAFREAKDFLVHKGWSIHENTIGSLDGVQDKSTVLVLDETKSPIVSNWSDEQLTALRALFDRGCRILWVTRGSQMRVTEPENGLMFGASRSLLSEYPTSLFMCLDIESETKTESLAAIDDALHHLLSATDLSRSDSEFVERDGIVHVSRVIEDSLVNRAEESIEKGAPVEEAMIQDHNSIIRLMTERVGSLDALMYTEIAKTSPILDDEVEVEVHAAGMNFKDLAGAMGFVPANEKRFGGECCGIVTQIGKDVSNVKPGDRVLMMKRNGGCFANRVRSRWHAIHLLPDWISFEEGTTLGIAVHTAVYGLITMADIRPGQSVLIHSASGGVGLAAIDICKHIGCEIFVTVGTEEKRVFLEENYGVTRDRMFSSRSTTFASQLMRRTNGKGVDVCLNSLTGDMLHESWRCMAEAGTLIEIGKKDMLDRNNLSMEPFDRNCSYRALDLSRSSISNEATWKTGTQIMEMIRARQIRPLYICKVFPHTETDEAFRYMSRGKHIGKVVISYENRVPIPYRPAAIQFELRSDGAYLIAGGLKGLCGSLAVYLARNGAKHIVTISRSGHHDPRSQKVIDDCNTLGATVYGIAGDVSKREDVERAFRAAPKPVVGVIQGAMVLRDKMFESMSQEEFRDVVIPKVSGTWNLHNAAAKQGPLDFFTLLASVSGMIGQMGQSNYAAANSFLDSFAAYRQQQGLPACSIDLGPVADVGYLDDNAILNRVFEARGWTAVNEALLHRILRASILQQTHHINASSSGQLITSIMPGNTPFEPLHRFSSLRPGAGSKVAQGSSSGEVGLNTKLAMLQNAPSGDVDHQTLLAAATDLVNSVLVRSLGLPEPLDPTRPLANYGVDSLVAVELRNWVRNELKTELSALDIVGARTLVELCETILKKIGNA